MQSKFEEYFEILQKRENLEHEALLISGLSNDRQKYCIYTDFFSYLENDPKDKGYFIECDLKSGLLLLAHEAKDGLRFAVLTCRSKNS